jgi:hypothetical protein
MVSDLCAAAGTSAIEMRSQVPPADPAGAGRMVRHLHPCTTGGVAMAQPRLVTALFLFAASLTGCSQYTYQPAENATATVRGRSAADYQIPPQAPQGDVRLASFGFSRVAPPNAPPDQTERVLHLRMIVSNNGAQPWHLDTRQQLLDVSGVGRFSPAFASSRQGVAGFPSVAVAPGSRRTIDLFYRLPAGMNHARDIAQFDVIWRVDVPGQVVVERTPFDRLQVVPEYAYGYGPYGYVDYGWGPFWWGDWGPGAVVGWPSW